MIALRLTRLALIVVSLAAQAITVIVGTFDAGLALVFFALGDLVAMAITLMGLAMCGLVFSFAADARAYARRVR